jgi:outer membrane protein OmpA-like peptidoglycan-associated protein
MKILTIGVFVLAGWVSLSTWLYVCKIKGLCNESNTVVMGAVTPNISIPSDSRTDTLAATPEVKPEAPEMLLVFFAFDKSAFVPDSDMNKFCDASIEYMHQNSEAGMLITGHTDAIGSDAYNHSLGYRRAQSVQEYFKSKGVATGKIAIESEGEKNPAETNSTVEGREKNRRASVTINN